MKGREIDALKRAVTAATEGKRVVYVAPTDKLAASACERCADLVAEAAAGCSPWAVGAMASRYKITLSNGGQIKFIGPDEKMRGARQVFFDDKWGRA